MDHFTECWARHTSIAVPVANAATLPEEVSQIGVMAEEGTPIQAAEPGRKRWSSWVVWRSLQHQKLKFWRWSCQEWLETRFNPSHVKVELPAWS